MDAAKTEAVIKAAAASGQSQVNLVENGCYYTVQVTKDNEQLKALCDKMNQSKDMVITYNFGENKEELRQGCDTNRPVRLETQSGNRG